MKKHILSAAILSLFAATSMAQDLKSAYFTDGYLYRHEMNPALGNDETAYISIPALGNLAVSVQGNFGLQDILHKNPRFGNGSDKKLTTFMNPYISDSEALSGFNKGDNKLITEVKATILSVGFKGFGGYNTVEINARAQAGAVAPYELFEFARNIGNKHYNIGTIGVNAQSFAEIGIGHSHKIGDNITVGAKVKYLLGIEDACLEVKDITADLSGEDKWTLSGKAQLDASMKGLKYKTKKEEYKSKPGEYNTIDKVEVDGAGVGGSGFAVDLGVDWKITEDIRVSAAVLDLGAISWSNNMQAINAGEKFTFNGFHDISTNKDSQNSLEKQSDSYGDQMTDFLNLKENGDQGSRSTSIGTTLNAGVEYTLPMYRKLSFGLLGTARMRSNYGWSEARLSANWKPLKWVSGGLNVATGTFGTSAGWVLNIHPTGINLFVGMDSFLGKLNKQFIPLNSKATLNMGLNIEI